MRRAAPLALALLLAACGEPAAPGPADAAVPSQSSDASDSSDASGLPDAGGAAPDAALTAIPVELPPGTRFCATGECEPAVVARVCPDTNRACAAPSTVQLAWRIGGRPFDRVAVAVWPGAEGYDTQVTSGPAGMFLNYVNVSGARALQLDSALAELSLLHYQVPVAWGTSMALDWEGSGLQSSTGRSFLFRFEPYALGVTHEELHREFDALVREEAALVDLPQVPYTVYLMPTELAVPLGGEGNWSFGGGVVTVNYGNPDWILANGGVRPLVMWTMSHEYSHELFLTVEPPFNANTTCLNEGVADALGNFVGRVPDADFCPAPDGRCQWLDGCAGVSEIHAKGNCLLWHFKGAGKMTARFLRGLFHPSRTWTFDTCDYASEQTGNSYVVYFSEALGEDAAAQVTAAGLPNAGTLAAARAALGL